MLERVADQRDLAVIEGSLQPLGCAQQRFGVMQRFGLAA